MKEKAMENSNMHMLNISMAAAVLICCLTSTMLNHFGWKFTYGDLKLEIIQKMTACISCMLVCQDNTLTSKKSAVNRIIITVIGGIVGIGISLIDTWLKNEWLMAFLVALGVLLTLYLCKKARVPYINARIGGVTCILVSCTLSGHARVWYAVFRFAGTLYGAFISILVTMIFTKFFKRKQP